MNPHSILSITIIALRHLARAQSDVVLPAFLGRHPVSIYDHELQTSRPDPLAPTSQLRRLMVTIYRPFPDNTTCPPEHQSLIPYAPPVVADALLNALLGAPNASSIISPVKVLNCSLPIPASSPSGSPLLLFSPGYGGTHHAYASTIQAAASAGYTVVAIDHTYESAAVVFPSDGEVAYYSAVTDEYNNSTAGQNFLQSVRIDDAISVLDAIERGDIPGLGDRYSNSSCSSSSSPQPPLRAIMYGHSFGGSTAVNVAALDDRVVAAANIDGPYYNPVANGTVPVTKPLLMMQSSALPPASGDWLAFFNSSHVRGWKTWVRPNGTAHYGYTDLPVLADLLGLRGTVMPEELVGTVDSGRLQEIVWRYTTDFFDFVLKGGEAPGLLVGPSEEFAEVEFVGHEGAKTGD